MYLKKHHEYLLKFVIDNQDIIKYAYAKSKQPTKRPIELKEIKILISEDYLKSEEQK